MKKHFIRQCAELAREAYTNKIKLIEETYFIENKKTDAQCFVCIKNKNIYIVFRGTSSKSDVLSDIKLWRTKCDYLEDTLIHSGFLEQYNSIRSNLINKLNEVIKDNTKNIIFTGHSLGASLSTIASLDFKLNHQTRSKDVIIDCITFASPRVGNKKFSKLFNLNITNSTRIVYHRDPVTFLPLFIRFNHVKGCIHLKKNGEVKKSDKYFFPFGCLISQHYMENYNDRIHNWLNDESFEIDI